MDKEKVEQSRTACWTVVFNGQMCCVDSGSSCQPGRNRIMGNQSVARPGELSVDVTGPVHMRLRKDMLMT